MSFVVRERPLLFFIIKIGRASAEHHVRFFRRDARGLICSKRRALPVRLEVIFPAALASHRSHAVISTVHLPVADERRTLTTFLLVVLGLGVVHGTTPASVRLLPRPPSSLQVEDGDGEYDEDAEERGYDASDDLDRG